MKELSFHNPRFEEVVRHALRVYDRPITEEEALSVDHLDCSAFTFDAHDCDALCAFKNLTCLYIAVCFENLSFLKELTKLEDLMMDFFMFNFDARYLLPLKKLNTLFISGGDVSDFAFRNFESVSALPCLEHLSLHEFGTVDLAPLKNMAQLKGFFCGYADEVYHIEAIAHLVDLEELTLIDICVPNLDFLRALKSHVVLELCGITVSDTVDLRELERFEECDLEEIVANGERIR